MKKLYLALSLLLVCNCVSISAKIEDKDFQEYLSRLKEVTELDVNHFKDVSPDDSTLVPKEYHKFIPGKGTDCNCEDEEYKWLKGVYIKTDNYVAALLLRVCWAYHDAYDHYLMENNGQEFVLVTYSPEGVVIDFKKVGQDGTPYMVASSYDSKHHALTVEQGALVDGENLHQYRDFVYNAEKHEYKIGKDGKISSKTVGKPYKKTVINEKAHGPEMTFEQFLSHFTKCDDAELDESVFAEMPKDWINDVLPLPSALPFLPETDVTCQCSETDRSYSPGKYVEKNGKVYCFVVRYCDMPSVYDFLVIEYSKDGKPKKADSIYYKDDDEKERDDIRAALTEAVKAKWAEICAESGE